MTATEAFALSFAIVLVVLIVVSIAAHGLARALAPDEPKDTER